MAVTCSSSSPLVSAGSPTSRAWRFQPPRPVVEAAVAQANRFSACHQPPRNPGQFPQSRRDVDVGNRPQGCGGAVHRRGGRRGRAGGLFAVQTVLDSVSTDGATCMQIPPHAAERQKVKALQTVQRPKGFRASAEAFALSTCHGRQRESTPKPGPSGKWVLPRRSRSCTPT